MESLWELQLELRRRHARGIGESEPAIGGRGGAEVRGGRDAGGCAAGQCALSLSGGFALSSRYCGLEASLGASSASAIWLLPVPLFAMSATCRGEQRQLQGTHTQHVRMAMMAVEGIRQHPHAQETLNRGQFRRALRLKFKRIFRT